MKKLLTTLIATTLLHTASCWALTPEQEAAKQTGISLFNQLRVAQHYLQIPASAGDQESQYLLADELRQTARGMTKESIHWFEAAAMQGDLYAMVQLSRQPKNLCSPKSLCSELGKTPAEWGVAARTQASSRAEGGDAEAMYIMYTLTGDIVWLEKSADHGNGYAEWMLAEYYKDGNGFFLFSSSRESKITNLLKSSAHNGYPPGMMAYGAELYRKGDSKAYQNWTIKAAQAGLVSSIFGLGYGYSHTPNTLELPYDIIKGRALISLLTELDGGGAMQEIVKSTLSDIDKKITPSELSASKLFALNWKAEHAPVSFFPPMLGQ